jgi:preprotein translocase subunit SecA
MKRFASERVAGLMERMGLEDDVAIESRLVSKTIESAQTRVEGFNFDVRKRVVEFDDVINRQRETIYAERDKVLRNEDLTDTVRAFLEDEVEALADQFLGAPSPDDWGMSGLSAALHTMGLEGPGTSEDDLWERGSRESITEHIHELTEARLEEREREIGETDWALVERYVLLRTIDSLWVEHLTEVDDMRRGIGLRGYAQQDPLNEFRREAFRLYEELRGLIRHQLASAIFRVTVTREPTPARVPVGAGAAGSRASAAGAAGAVVAPGAAGGAQPMRESRGDGPTAGSNGGAPSDGARPGYTPSGARIGRNDTCWCGSGLKYKKCHGR